MRELSLCSVVLLLLTVPCFAGQAEPAADTLVVQPEINRSLPTASTPDASPKSSCTATADCWDGSTAFCSGSSSCYSLDSDCPWDDGYARCDGVYHPCPPCPFCGDGLKCQIDADCTSFGGPECNCYCRWWDPRDPHGLCTCIY